MEDALNLLSTAYAWRDRDLDNGPNSTEQLIEMCMRSDSPSKAYERYQAALDPEKFREKMLRQLKKHEKLLLKLHPPEEQKH